MKRKQNTTIQLNKRFFGTIFFITFSSFYIMTNSSCKKLVEVDAPNNSLVTTSVFDDDGTAITAQLGAYYGLEGLWSLTDQYTGLSSDELINYSTTQYKIDLYRNNLNAQNDGGINGSWSSLYKCIYQENAILENVAKSSKMTDRVKKLMTGEALFTRAYCYFHLVNMYGDVPLVTSTDYNKNSTLARTSKNDVYSQLIGDLKLAQTLLSADYLDASNNTGASDRIRPTTWAADALLARIYLYAGKYDLAEQQATLVINNTSMFSLVSDLTQVFKANSTEAIWQLSPTDSHLYTPEGNAFILVTPPNNTTSVSLSAQLLAAFEVGDNRRQFWVNSYSKNGSTWYFPFKYQDNKSAGSLSEYSMVFRLAELYLIRAEARAQQGEANATDDLNIIRSRAGLANYSGTTDKASLLAAIYHERQVELFTENHRWFDLKRTQTVDGLMQTVTPSKGGVWTSYQQLYPLSVTDLQYDPSLIQNSGY